MPLVLDENSHCLGQLGDRRLVIPTIVQPQTFIPQRFYLRPFGGAEVRFGRVFVDRLDVQWAVKSERWSGKGHQYDGG